MAASLELAVACNDIDRARRLAERCHGALCVDDRDTGNRLPFRALATVVTDDIDAVLEAADVGAYVVLRRVVRARAAVSGGQSSEENALPGVIGLYTMVHHPKLTHAQADTHWRDQHAPLALQHHVGMTFYTQLSVVSVLKGSQWDGFAFCGFDSYDDLRERMFADDHGRRAIERDIGTFADTKLSPRRLVASEYRY